MSPRYPFKWLAALFLAATVMSAAMPNAVPARAQQGPADRECPVRCVRQFNQVFEECIAAGRDTLECAKIAQEALTKCLRECQPKPTPKPGANGCEDKCREKSNGVLKECLAAGGSQADCDAKARTAFTACMKECTPATRQPSCRGACEQKRAEAVKACVAAGGTEEQCKKDAEAGYQECLKACPTEVPKPTALTCEGKCGLRSQEIFKKCINDGGTEADCQAKAKAALEECVKNECKPDATRVPSCASLCEREAEAHYKECLNAGGGADSCRAKMEVELKECRAKCPTATPKPTELSCTARCEVRAKEAFEKCIKDGGSEADCKAKQQATYAECAQGCDKPRATETPSCKGRCEQEANAHFEQCLANGGTEADCKAKRAEELAACVAKCPTVQPKPTDKPRPTELTCAARCGLKATEVYEKCIKDGGGEDDCRAKEKATLAECVQGCDKPRATATPTCRGLCELQAKEVYLRCREAGGGEDECDNKRRAALEECSAKCPTATPKPTDRPNCQDDCHAKSRTVYTTCRTSSDRSVEDCWALAANALRDCMRTCLLPGVEASCTAACAKLREPALRLCKSIDGVDSCEDRAAKVVADCVAACPTPAPRPYVIDRLP